MSADRIQRARHSAIVKATDRIAEVDSPSLGVFVGQVVNLGMMPTGIEKYVIVNPVTVGGAEVERGAGTFGVDTSRTIPVILLGIAPVVGDNLICTMRDSGRWVAEKYGNFAGGSGYITLPYCQCQVPPMVKMTSADPNCNYKMFQTCEIVYGPPPASLSKLNLGAQVFLSTSTFYDPISASNFYYYFFCQYNGFYLTRVYPTSPYGSPYQDAVLYTWYVGGYGNTCSPFHLDGGTPFSGSDASCNVTIDVPS